MKVTYAFASPGNIFALINSLLNYTDKKINNKKADIFAFLRY